MCGRYSWFTGWDVLEGRWRVQSLLEDDDRIPHYNAAPSQRLPVILNTDPQHVRVGRWGLVPFWSKDERAGIINARAETVAEKPAFRQAFRKRRCLVPADGFYEWQRTGRVKVPYRITLKDGAPFAFAGIWEEGNGTEPATYAIITTTPNELVGKIHDRMPVILAENDERLWLSEWLNARQFLDLLTPYSAKAMAAYPVSLLVNSPRNNVPEILRAA